MRLHSHLSPLLFGMTSRSRSRSFSSYGAHSYATTPIYASDSVTIYSTGSRPPVVITPAPVPVLFPGPPPPGMFGPPPPGMMFAPPPPELVMQDMERRRRHQEWVEHRRQHPPDEPLGINAPPEPNVYSRKAKREEVGRTGFSRATNRGQDGVFFDPRKGDFKHGKAPRDIPKTYGDKLIGPANSVFTTTGGEGRRPIDPTEMNEATMRAIQKAGRDKKREKEKTPRKDTRSSSGHHHSRSVAQPTAFVYNTGNGSSSSKRHPSSSHRPKNYSTSDLPSQVKSASKGKGPWSGWAKGAKDLLKRL